jgi:hypothetical protein
MAIISDHDDGVLLTVWVVPGSSRNVIGGRHGDALKVRVTAPPERGKANRAVLALLAARCGTAAELVAGGSGRQKTVLLRGIDQEAAAAALSL